MFRNHDFLFCIAPGFKRIFTWFTFYVIFNYDRRLHDHGVTRLEYKMVYNIWLRNKWDSNKKIYSSVKIELDSVSFISSEGNSYFAQQFACLNMTWLYHSLILDYLHSIAISSLNANFNIFNFKFRFRNPD